MIEIPKVKCKLCGHSWAPRTGAPVRCPACYKMNWMMNEKETRDLSPNIPRATPLTEGT